MCDKIFYKGALLFGAVALVLWGGELFFLQSNRALQTEISQRQNLLAQGASFDQLNRALAQDIATTVLKGNNADLKALLTAQGISVQKPASSASGESRPPVPSASTPKK